MEYYFWVDENYRHDKELAIIEAKDLGEAWGIFRQDHPEDEHLVMEIYIDKVFAPIWSKQGGLNKNIDFTTGKY